MQASQRGRAHATSFFIRLWLEPGGTTGQWRGQVRHVQSSEVAYFTNTHDLLAFLAAHGARALIHKGKEVNDNAVPDHPDPRAGEMI